MKIWKADLYFERDKNLGSISHAIKRNQILSVTLGQRPNLISVASPSTSSCWEEGVKDVILINIRCSSNFEAVSMFIL